MVVLYLYLYPPFRNLWIILQAHYFASIIWLRNLTQLILSKVWLKTLQRCRFLPIFFFEKVNKNSNSRRWTPPVSLIDYSNFPHSHWQICIFHLQPTPTLPRGVAWARILSLSVLCLVCVVVRFCSHFKVRSCGLGSSFSFPPSSAPFPRHLHRLRLPLAALAPFVPLLPPLKLPSDVGRRERRAVLHSYTPHSLSSSPSISPLHDNIHWNNFVPQNATQESFSRSTAGSNATQFTLHTVQCCHVV